MIFIYSIRQGLGNRKIGVTNYPRKRIRSIRRTYPRARWAVLLPTPFIALFLERIFHQFLRGFQRTRRGSGRTEWFRLIWPISWIIDILITVVVALSWWGVWKVFVFCAHWYWGEPV